MLRLKTDIVFNTRLGLAEAAENNPQFILSFDFKTPGRIVAFISPEIHHEIAKQFIKNPDLDGVSFGASLSSLIGDASEYLEEDAAVDDFVRSFYSAIEQLRAFRNERQAALEAAACDRCSHKANDHYRPALGDISCHHPHCGCPEFSPLVKLQPNLIRQHSPEQPRKEPAPLISSKARRLG